MLCLSYCQFCLREVFKKKKKSVTNFTLCLLGQDKTHFFQVEKLLLNKGDIIYGSFPKFLCDGLGEGGLV